MTPSDIFAPKSESRCNMASQTISNLAVYESRFVSVEIIQLDMSYGRSVKPAALRKIINAFDPRAATGIILSERNPGEFHCIDGNHRLAAMRQLGIDRAWCIIFRDLSRAEEAALRQKYHVRANPVATEEFRAALIAQEPVALAIEAIVQESGWQLDLFAHGARAQGITAVVELRNIYRQGGGSLLIKVLSLINQCWPSNKTAVRREILAGTREFLWKYSDLDLLAIAHKLKLTAPEVLIQGAKVNAGYFQGAIPIHVARLMLREYNKGKRDPVEDRWLKAAKNGA